MAGIGIVSTIDFQHTKQQTAFQAGLNQAVGFHIQDKLGFNRKKLGAAINGLVNSANVDLIVTVGGLVSCHEAILNNSATPFISLIGWLPAAPFPQPVSTMFKGCVTLDTIGKNTNRIAWIGNAPWSIGVGNVGLLFDPNTAMATQEVAAWTAAGGGLAVPADYGVANPDNYSTDFEKFTKANMQAVVVSAAPTHHAHKEQLISAANSSGLKICYPLQGYANAGGNNKPISNQAVAIGPDLDAANNKGAYFLLGVMAATVLGGADPNPPSVVAPTVTTAI